MAGAAARGGARLHAPLHVAILGSVGVPARYGGFETLAEQLVRYHAAAGRPERLSVYCSAPAYPDGRPARLERAELIYSRHRANGASSVLYDATTLAGAARRGVDVALLLGVSGAVALPLLAGGRMRIATHVDGLEWRRAKWSGPARAFLRWSEGLAVRHSDGVVADSPAIADHLRAAHGIAAEVIAYGGDHAGGGRGGGDRVVAGDGAAAAGLPDGVAPGFALALCRIVPENNAAMILEAFAAAGRPLVFVGNWADSRHGRRLRARFAGRAGLHLLDPVHDPEARRALRRAAGLYVHGHSAGGTNPALVEMMQLGLPILAFDCVFNRQTTRGEATFFASAAELVARLSEGPRADAGARLRRIAQEEYRWDLIGARYFALFERIGGLRRG